MAAADDLQTTYDQLAANLAEITASPKPTYSIDGQKVSWAEYHRLLTDQLKAVRELIAADSGPYEFRTQALP
ncbi:MAG: hypothetical protein AB7K24_05740 [Gemmataceae bacterium]